MKWLRRVVGTLRAIWDNARQLVELRDEIEELAGAMETLREELQRLDERTRKQRYRAENAAEPPPQTPPLQLADRGARSDILRRAKAAGIVR